MNYEFLSKIWTKKATNAERHFSKNIDEKTQKKFTDRVEKKLISKSGIKEGDVIFDWGCGGGIIAKKLSEKYQVYCFDISPKSIEECSKNCKGSNVKDIIFIPDMLKNKSYIDLPQPNLVLLHDVVHHFPSFEYYENMMNFFMNDLNAERIAFKFKLNNENPLEQKGKYSSNYLDGIIMSEEIAQKPFQTSSHSISFFDVAKEKFSYRGNTFQNAYLVAENKNIK